MELRQQEGRVKNTYPLQKWEQVIHKKRENLVKKLISQKNENGFYP